MMPHLPPRQGFLDVPDVAQDSVKLARGSGDAVLARQQRLLHRSNAGLQGVGDDQSAGMRR